MAGYNIGIGVGLRYPSVPSFKGGGLPPDPDITDALILEDGELFLMEDGSYFMLDTQEASEITDAVMLENGNGAVLAESGGYVSAEKERVRKVKKSYWNF